MQNVVVLQGLELSSGGTYFELFHFKSHTLWTAHISLDFWHMQPLSLGHAEGLDRHPCLAQPVRLKKASWPCGAHRWPGM